MTRIAEPTDRRQPVADETPASPVLGLLLDHHLPRLVFVVAAIALFGAIGSAVTVGAGNLRTGRRAISGAAASRGDAADRPA